MEASGQAEAMPVTVSQQPPRAVAVRVSDRERDAVASRLQDAFAEGRLNDDEFDVRMRAALTATFSNDLDPLTADLPDAAQMPARLPGPERRPPGRLAVALKSSVRRGGRWRVPGRFTSVVYKGGGCLDLRAAELAAPVTTMVTVAYKSDVDVLVPPGVRVELAGFGVSKGWSPEEDLEPWLPADAPVVRVRGIAYKGTIEVRTRPGAPRPGLIVR